MILDEASSIDQILAAPALLRGARAVVAGDPHQLRHVSFLADDQLWSALAAHELDESPEVAARLDVRRNSLFDVAAGGGPVLVLDEQFRSDPHLVEFVARRIYEGRVHIANRSPATASKDCVDLVRLEGSRDGGGVVRVEVDRVIEELRALLRRRQTSVGVVTPFRAQADALEEAALRAFDVDELEALDLRVGTVHAFQGNERDVVVASLGLGPTDGASSWRFAEDPHLFTVFVTRARRRLLFLYSADPPEGGLLHAYLAQANSPPGPLEPAGPVSAWADAIGRDLDSSGIAVTCAYPSGRHIVDVCVEDPARCVAIDCDVHARGPQAHIERHLDLLRRGWEITEAHRSRWGQRRGELIVRLVTDLRAR
ncbi:MAG: DEAD/DEAH box helicase [Acidimicrobiales bacterium]